MIWGEISLVFALIRAFGWWHRRMVAATDRKLSAAAEWAARRPAPAKATYGDYTRLTDRPGEIIEYEGRRPPKMRVVWDEPMAPARHYTTEEAMTFDPPRKYHLEPVVDLDAVAERAARRAYARLRMEMNR